MERCLAISAASLAALFFFLLALASDRLASGPGCSAGSCKPEPKPEPEPSPHHHTERRVGNIDMPSRPLCCNHMQTACALAMDRATLLRYPVL